MFMHVHTDMHGQPAPLLRTRLRRMGPSGFLAPGPSPYVPALAMTTGPSVSPSLSSLLSPPGRTTVYASPDLCRSSSARFFQNSTPQKRLRGLRSSSAPMEVTSTKRRTWAWRAAATRFLKEGEGHGWACDFGG